MNRSYNIYIYIVFLTSLYREVSSIFYSPVQRLIPSTYSLHDITYIEYPGSQQPWRSNRNRLKEAINESFAVVSLFPKKRSKRKTNAN